MHERAQLGCARSPHAWEVRTHTHNVHTSDDDARLPSTSSGVHWPATVAPRPGSAASSAAASESASTYSAASTLPRPGPSEHWVSLSLWVSYCAAVIMHQPSSSGRHCRSGSVALQPYSHASIVASFWLHRGSTHALGPMCAIIFSRSIKITHGPEGDIAYVHAPASLRVLLDLSGKRQVVAN